MHLAYYHDVETDSEMRRLIVFGVAGADWPFLHGLLDRGRLPGLAGLVERGVSGDLTCPAPVHPAAAWTTLATGCLADRHGLTGSYVTRPDGAGVRPVGQPDWHAAAFWQVLEAAGRRTLTIGWPATQPAVAWPGVHIDARFAQPSGPDFERWALPPDCIAPPALRQDLREARLHPGDLRLEDVQALAPGLRQIDQERDRRLATLGVALARATSVQAAATALMVNRDWDVLTVHFDLLAGVRTQLVAAGLTDDAVFGPVADGAAVFLDMMLRRLMEMAGPADVLVVSPIGLGAGRPDPSGGMFAWAGDGIPADTLLHGVTVQDIAPTLLRRVGLRITVDGAPIDALTPANLPAREVHLPIARPQGGSSESVRFLLDLGYPDAVTPAQQSVMAGADRDARLGRAAAKRARGDLAGATAELTALLGDWPDDVAVLVGLAECHAEAGAFHELRPLADTLQRVAPDLPAGLLAQAAALWWEGQDKEADALLARAEPEAIPELRVLMGLLALRRGRPEAARRQFSTALEAAPRLCAAANGLARAAAALGDAAAAEAALRRSIAIAFHQPEVHRALGELLLVSGRVAEAPRALWAAQSLSGSATRRPARKASAGQASVATDPGD